MNLTPVTSSNIAAIGHSAERGTLVVQFVSGATYEYAGVPRAVYDAFLASGSKGRYFAAHIKAAYPAEQRAGAKP